jgi:hypothetical protein
MCTSRLSIKHAIFKLPGLINDIPTQRVTPGMAQHDCRRVQPTRTAYRTHSANAAYRAGSRSMAPHSNAHHASHQVILSIEKSQNEPHSRHPRPASRSHHTCSDDACGEPIGRPRRTYLPSRASASQRLSSFRPFAARDDAPRRSTRRCRFPTYWTDPRARLSSMPHALRHLATASTTVWPPPPPARRRHAAGTPPARRRHAAGTPPARRRHAAAAFGRAPLTRA